MKRFIGVALIMISSIAYGTMPIFVRFAYADGASPLTVLFLRFSLAAVILLIYMTASRTPFPQRGTVLQLVLLGMFGYVGQSLTYYLAISLAPASLIVLLMYLSPVLVTAGSIIVFHDRLNWKKIIALLIALAGAGLTISTRGYQPVGQENKLFLGISFGVLSAVIGAIYVLIGSRVLRVASAIPATTIIITSSAVTYTAAALVQGLTFPIHWYGYSAIFAIATLSTVIAIGAFMAGLKRIGPANASILSVLEPISAVFLAVLVLDETIYLEQIFGGLMIILAVLLVSRTV